MGCKVVLVVVVVWLCVCVFFWGGRGEKQGRVSWPMIGELQNCLHMAAYTAGRCLFWDQAVIHSCMAVSLWFSTLCCWCVCRML